MLAKDSASSAYGNGDGFTLCGTRTYTISPTTYPLLTISGDVLALVSTDPAEATKSLIKVIHQKFKRKRKFVLKKG